jgi:hypothetical protein
MVQHLVQKYPVNLLHVYIREAHPKDEWAWAGDAISCSIRQPRTLEERLDVGRRFAQDYGIDPTTIAVDNLDNTMEQLYKGWPERLYVIHQKKIVFVGTPGPFGYIPEEVDRFLAQYL